MKNSSKDKEFDKLRLLHDTVKLEFEKAEREI